MRLDDIRSRLHALGAKPCHARLVLRAWMQALPLDSGPRLAGDFLPLRLREALPALAWELQTIARISLQHTSADGSVRVLLGLADGQTVESVLVPREGLCISTQVGCAVGCFFCRTGQDGLQRQLGSAEIVAGPLWGIARSAHGTFGSPPYPESRHPRREKLGRRTSGDGREPRFPQFADSRPWSCRLRARTAGNGPRLRPVLTGQKLSSAIPPDS